VSFWVLVQVLLNLVLGAGVVGMWVRLSRPAKDDPRLSKGLQLLQSKISILEDLSDRTEVQVQQLTALLEQKCKEIQAKIQTSEKQMVKIDQSMQKSLEVAKIFQDRIPHTEIVERQNTIKYVKAARLAHQGLSVDEIALQSDLSRGEIEFIAKVNKDQLMFCEDSLPEWIADPNHPENQNVDESLNMQGTLMRETPRDLSAVFEVPHATASLRDPHEALKKLGEAFKAADKAPVTPAAATKESATASNIRPVQFRRIDMNRDLG
jgi:hypothetical protein